MRRLPLLLFWVSLLAGCGSGTGPVTPALPSATATGESAQVTINTTAENVGTAQPDTEGFWPLTLDDFIPFQADSTTWTQVSGEIICSGSPKGYLYSRQNYDDFTWRAEFRYVPAPDIPAADLEKSNTGFMVYIQEPHKVWPRSLEVQGRYDELCSIKSNGGVPALTINDDTSARTAARLPVGEWNAVEIVSRSGSLQASLNGQQICSSAAGELTSGPIGLQSELFEVHFRNVRIRPE